MDRAKDRVRDRDMGRVRDRVRLRGLAIADPNRNFQWAFLSIGAMNMRTKFKLSSFTCSRDNREYPK